MKRTPWIWIVPWIGLAVTASWFVRQRMETRALERTIRAASTSVLHRTDANHKPPPLPRPVKPDTPEPATTDSVSLSPSELLAQLGARARALIASGLGEAHPEIFISVDEALRPLTPDQWAAIVAGDSAFTFAQLFNRAGVPVDQRIDAIVRWRAWQRLAKADPEAALRLTERGDLKDTSGEMINLITESLQRWATTDPAAALAWGRTQADSLPLGINHAHMALEALARHDMAGAWATARREGIDVLQAMAYLSRAVATRDACDAFMHEIAALQAAAPHGFVGGANQYYTDLTEKIARSAGFDEARAFAERWASTLEWRDDVALAAARSTFSRTPNPRTTEAADWLINFTPEPRRAAAAERLVAAWAEEDFSQPAAWLQQYSHTPWHDAALAALCRQIAPFDPAAAAEWAAGIIDPSLRQKVLDNPP